MTPRELVLQQVFALPLADQAFVAQAVEDNLLSHLPPGTDHEANGDETFLLELRRRSSAYHAGETTARDAFEVMADLWRRQTSEAKQTESSQS